MKVYSVLFWPKKMVNIQLNPNALIDALTCTICLSLFQFQEKVIDCNKCSSIYCGQCVLQGSRHAYLVRSQPYENRDGIDIQRRIACPITHCGSLTIGMYLNRGLQKMVHTMQEFIKNSMTTCGGCDEQYPFHALRWHKALFCSQERTRCPNSMTYR